MPTLVTCLFDLSKRADALPNTRPLSFYEKHCEFVLSLPYNLIIFCEPELYPFLWKKRREYKLLQQTYFFLTRLEEMPLYRYYDKIAQNRSTNPEYYKRGKNTPTYFIMGCSKFGMMAKAIEMKCFGEDPQKELYIWLDLGLGHVVNPVGVQYIEQIIKENREKVSLCAITPTSTELFEPKNWKEYFSEYRYQVASTAFTGRGDYMLHVCQAIEDKFIQVVEAGYGETDEQIVPLVHFEHKEWFQFYYGDYYEVLCNYVSVSNSSRGDLNPLGIVTLYIESCRAKGQNENAHWAAKHIWKGLDSGALTIESDNVFFRLIETLFRTTWWSLPHQLEVIPYVQTMIKHIDARRNTFQLVGSSLFRTLDYMFLLEPFRSKPFYVCYARDLDMDQLTFPDEALVMQITDEILVPGKDSYDGSMYERLRRPLQGHDASFAYRGPDKVFAVSALEDQVQYKKKEKWTEAIQLFGSGSRSYKDYTLSIGNDAGDICVVPRKSEEKGKVYGVGSSKSKPVQAYVWKNRVTTVPRPDWNIIEGIPAFCIDQLMEMFDVPKVLIVAGLGNELDILKGCTQKIPMIQFTYWDECVDVAVDAVQYLSTIGFTRFAIQLPNEGPLEKDDYWSKEKTMDSLTKLCRKKRPDHGGVVWCV